MSRFKLVRRAMLAGGAAMVAGAGAIGVPATAQPAPTPPPPPEIGPPQLRDFQLEPRERIVTQPRPAPAPQTPPPAAQPRAERPVQTPPQTTGTGQSRATAPAARAPVDAPVQPSGTPSATAPTEPQPVPAAPVDLAPATSSADAPAPVAPTAPPAPAGPSASSGGRIPLWVLALGGLALAVVAFAFLRRRRASQRRASALPEPVAPVVQPQAPRAPRPDPVPRPWLEIELVPERTTADPNESVVEFELTVRNSGGSPARNVQLQAKLICSTPAQDKEIGDFHRKKPGEHRTLQVQDIPAGQELRMNAQVDIKRADIKVMQVDGRMLFIPLVAVNAFYEWGAARSGQTSKSFLVGREKPEPADKMAPFRLDQGPRVYRTVGQRPYKVERRV